MYEIEIVLKERLHCFPIWLTEDRKVCDLELTHTVDKSDNIKTHQYLKENEEPVKENGETVVENGEGTPERLVTASFSSPPAQCLE